MLEGFVIPFTAPDFHVPDEVGTYPRLVYRRACERPEWRCFGTREYLGDPAETRGDFEWYSYTDVVKMATELYYGLLALGLKRGDLVGLMSPNRTEWALVDLACGALGVVTVPLYDTQTSEDMAFAANNAEIVALFLTADRLGKWFDASAACPTVKHVILFDDRYDDRCFLHGVWNLVSNAARPLPTSVSIVPHPFEYFDEQDQKAGIADPRPLTKEEKRAPEGTRVRYPLRAVCTPIDDTGLFSYLPDRAVKHTLGDNHSALAEPLKLVTHTFHILCEMGRESEAFAGVDFKKYRSLHYVLGDRTLPLYDFETTTPDTLLSLVYTSGTTGKPKGVQISHRNAMWTSASMQTHRVLNGKKQEFMISFLPNAHIYQRVLQGVLWRDAGATGFWQGDVKYLLSDVQALRPTCFIVVPRILNRLFEGITGKVEALSRLKRSLFFAALASRKASLQAGKPWAWWTKFFFKETKNLVGGRVRECVSGSAPLSQKVGEFLRIVCDMQVFEGWGMTETAAHGVVQPVDTNRWGSVGQTLDSSTQIKLVSVPEMEYFTTDLPNPRGEIWIRGPSVFSGYYKDPESTNAVLVEDGWFRTGDIGLYNVERKELQLIDRMRGIFKLSQGEFICTATIEDAMLQSRFVDHVYMYGDRLQSYVLGVVVPSFSAVRAELGIDETVADMDLVLRKDVIALVTKDVTQACRSKQLRTFEIPKALILEGDPWTPENGMLTPAMKVKRLVLQQKYRTYLDELYHRLNKLGNQRLGPEEAADIVLKVLDDGPKSDAGSQMTGLSGLSGMGN